MSKEKSDKIYNELGTVILGANKIEFYDNISYILEALRDLDVIENEEFENIDIKLSKIFGYEVEDD